jgi:SAM-dependent methyltransferase
MTLRTLFYKLPPSIRIIARKIFYWRSYLIKQEQYPNGLPVPPKSLIFTGGGNFQKTGFKFMEIFKKHGLVTPEDTLLDIGSGIGRIAAPFTNYLSVDGKYFGIDIMSQGINWCQNNISSQFPNFDFRLIDLKNDLYKNDGGEAAELTFPYSSDFFDFIFLISVFTHMMPLEVENYMKEISRMLKKGKSCLMTLFLFDDPALLVNNSFGKFKLIDANHALMSENVKSANVAFSEEYLKQLCNANNFKITHISYGAWRNNKPVEDFQDYVIIEKQ